MHNMKIPQWVRTDDAGYPVTSCFCAGMYWYPDKKRYLIGLYLYDAEEREWEQVVDTKCRVAVPPDYYYPIPHFIARRDD